MSWVGWYSVSSGVPGQSQDLGEAKKGSPPGLKRGPAGFQACGLQNWERTPVLSLPAVTIRHSSRDPMTPPPRSPPSEPAASGAASCPAPLSWVLVGLPPEPGCDIAAPWWPWLEAAGPGDPAPVPGLPQSCAHRHTQVHMTPRWGT